MLRLFAATLVTSAIGLAAGCSTCCSPYDYCGPLPHQQCPGECCCEYRENSILSGPGGVVYDQGTVYSEEGDYDEGVTYDSDIYSQAAPQTQPATPSIPLEPGYVPGTYRETEGVVRNGEPTLASPQPARQPTATVSHHGR